LSEHRPQSYEEKLVTAANITFDQRTTSNTLFLSQVEEHELPISPHF